MNGNGAAVRGRQSLSLFVAISVPHSVPGRLSVQCISRFLRSTVAGEIAKQLRYTAKEARQNAHMLQLFGGKLGLDVLVGVVHSRWSGELDESCAQFRRRYMQ